MYEMCIQVLLLRNMLHKTRLSNQCLCKINSLIYMLDIITNYHAIISIFILPIVRKFKRTAKILKKK